MIFKKFSNSESEFVPSSLVAKVESYYCYKITTFCQEFCKNTLPEM